MSTTDKPSWQLAEQICEVPSVDEAIRTFVDDNTADNAIGMVLAVLEHVAATEAAKATGTAGEIDADAEMAKVKRDVELMGVGFLVDGKRCSLDRITWFNRPGDTWLPPPPGYPVQAALQPMTMSYVQNVPDQCDRITWRGAYYHLKEGAEAARQPAPAEQPYRHIKSGKLYELLHIGALEADLTVSAIYRCTQTGQVWVRPMTEFTEKFELAATNRSQP